MDNSRFLAFTAVGIVLAALAGCGGGGDGGGGGSPDVDSPIPAFTTSSAAIVTTTNASQITANVTGNSTTAAVVGGLSVEKEDGVQSRGSALVDLAQRLSRILRDTVAHANKANAAPQPMSGVVPVDENEPCDFGNGSVHISGTLDDGHLGTLQVSFENCLVVRDRDSDLATNDSINVNGPATLRVDAVASPFPSLTDFTLSFALLTLRRPGLSLDVGGTPPGTLRTEVDIATSTVTITANLVTRDNVTSKLTKAEGLVVVNVYDNLDMPSLSNTTLLGRVIDQEHGYVDVTTPATLLFASVNQDFPSSGQLLLTGEGNRSIHVTAVSAKLAMLQLDLDGDGLVDNTATLKWTDLTGPIGVDLGDSDADGMHNSWEAFYGPTNTTDDVDLDGFDSLAEYLAGTNPNDINSHP